MLNVITLMGRLTKDPDCRTTPSGVSVATWYLAVDRDYQDKNGNARRAYEVIVQGFYFGDSGAKPQQSAQQTPQATSPQQGYQQQGYQQQAQRPPQQQFQQQDAFSNMGTQVPFDEEVPF